MPIVIPAINTYEFISFEITIPIIAIRNDPTSGALIILNKLAIFILLSI